ncbi:hypothetical protein [Pyrobaculum calidifontis]|uniref:Uncharacterized protein n=1 Tax=Pyrobaculum calidifontis (strain DSM 21063 / JCM 11548 / VA1) TaxID=410359 RepID=A3MWP0_PYRCJ|nr:hypothetical protein [Pyrobaculum calidifontis]ABO09057.1 conserved hypothetical protein [Pyrobaculum calidifontis JCM 11548]
MRQLLYLLAVAVFLAASTLVMTYNVKPGGAVTSSVSLQEVLVNNGPSPVNVSGVTVPPYSAVVLERPAQNVYPPFLAVDVDVSYVNGVYRDGVLWADNTTVVRLLVKLRPLLPVSVPVVVSVATDGKVALLYDVAPTSVTQVSGSTVYYWALLVGNYTEFKLGLRIREFGSFGAVRLPTVSITATLDLNGTLSAFDRQTRELNSAVAQLQNFSRVVSLFTETAYGQLQNLTRLIQLLNLTGLALGQGASALNTSTYALEALRRQVAALGDAAAGVSQVLNRSLLLVDYQYLALITAANLLETQSAALASYDVAAGQTIQGLAETRRQLFGIRSNLLAIRQSIDLAIGELESAKRALSQLNLTQGERPLDAAILQLRSLRQSVDSLLGIVDSLIAIVDSSVNTLEATRKSLGELAPLLNSTAASTRGNATALKQGMPQIILNASKNLDDVAANLYKTADEVSKYVAPLYNASATLRRAGDDLVHYARGLRDYQVEQLAALPRLGFVESALYNYTAELRRQLYELSTRRAAVEMYLAVVNATRVEVRYFIELPPAMRNTTIPLPAVATTPQQRDTMSFQMPLAIVAVALAITVLLVIRRERR